MSLHAELLQLVAPLRPGDELAVGVRFLDASAEVGLQLVFDVRGVDVRVTVTPVGEAPCAARSKRFGFSYRSEEGGRRISSKLGLTLCQAIAARASRNEDAVVARLEHRARESSPDATRVREVHVDRLLETAGDSVDRFYKLSPYVGCLIGCRYCYAQEPIAGLRRLERLPPARWGSYVDVRVNAAEVLARELATFAPRPLKFCPIVSDPYQAVEARYGVTRACLETLQRAAPQWPTLLLTRSKLVARDADVLAAMPSVWVGASIPTADDAVREHFEPRAASIPERAQTLIALRAAGVRTFAVVQPMLPGPVDALAALLADAASSVSVDVLRGEGLATPDFDDPRYAFGRTDEWQRSQAGELVAALAARGIPVWTGDLPPELLRGLRLE